MEQKIKLEKKQMSNDDQAAVLYGLVDKIAQKKYEYELQRENIVIDQAKNIQAVFSIISVALLTLLPFLADKLEGKISINLLIFAYVWIFTALIISFVIACIIQIRKKKNFWDNIEKVENTVKENYQTLLKKSEQKKWSVDNYKKILSDFAKENDDRMFLINLSLSFIIFAVISTVIAFLLILFLCI